MAPEASMQKIIGIYLGILLDTPERGVRNMAADDPGLYEIFFRIAPRAGASAIAEAAIHLGDFYSRHELFQRTIGIYLTALVNNSPDSRHTINAPEYRTVPTLLVDRLKPDKLVSLHGNIPFYGLVMPGIVTYAGSTNLPKKSDASQTPATIAQKSAKKPESRAM